MLTAPGHSVTARTPVPCSGGSSAVDTGGSAPTPLVFVLEREIVGCTHAVRVLAFFKLGREFHAHTDSITAVALALNLAL